MPAGIRHNLASTAFDVGSSRSANEGNLLLYASPRAIKVYL